MNLRRRYLKLESYSILHTEFNNGIRIEDLCEARSIIASKIFKHIASVLKYVDTSKRFEKYIGGEKEIKIGFTLFLPAFHLEVNKSYTVVLNNGIKEGTDDTKIIWKVPVQFLNFALDAFDFGSKRYKIYSLINDSVTALLAARFLNPNKEIPGVISFGTGFNIALETSSEYYNSELDGYNSEELLRTVHDQLIGSLAASIEGRDKPKSYSPTAYALEKIISGRYLGYNLEQCLNYYYSPTHHRFRTLLIK